MLTSDELGELIELIRELGKQRQFYTRSITRQRSSAVAFVRRAAGWSPDLSPRDRARINATARRVASRGLSGKPQSPADAPIVALTGASLEVVRRALLPLLAAQGAVEDELRRAAAELPVAAWIASVPGAGLLGLAVVVAEAGDLGSYRLAGALAKRFGLTPFRGRAPSTWRVRGGLTSGEWEIIGYSPRRAGTFFGIVATNLLRHRTSRAARTTRRGTPPPGAVRPDLSSPVRDFALIYHDARQRVDRTHPDWPARRRHLHAMRIMSQEFLRALRREWRRATRAAAGGGPAVEPGTSSIGGARPVGRSACRSIYRIALIRRSASVRLCRVTHLVCQPHQGVAEVLDLDNAHVVVVTHGAGTVLGCRSGFP